VEQQILRIFALAIARADSRTLRAHGRKASSFTWFQYRGDPLPAMCAHRALLAAGFVHESLSALEAGYVSALTAPEASMALLCDLLSIRVARSRRLNVPPVSTLVIAPRDEILELCRLLTMVSSCGARRIAGGPGAAMLPQLAACHARDWDIEASSALLRACQYLGLSHSIACKWTIEWLLDQQQSDGRFGLLRAESSKCGWDPADWRTYFEPTVHALWALADITRTSGLVDMLRPAHHRQRRH
jgi:hypothetical protein